MKIVLKVYVLARTTPSSPESLSSTDVAVAMKTVGAKGPYFHRRRASVDRVEESFTEKSSTVSSDKTSEGVDTVSLERAENRKY